MHVNTSDPMGLQAKVASLERRIRYIEVRAFGETRPEEVPRTLYHLYANALMGHVELTQMSADLWNHVALGLSEESILRLSRLTEDPFSWRPLLFVLDYLQAHGFDTDLAAKHVLSVAQALLTIQGLGRIRPEDLLGWVLDLRSAYQLTES